MLIHNRRCPDPCECNISQQEVPNMPVFALPNADGSVLSPVAAAVPAAAPVRGKVKSVPTHKPTTSPSPEARAMAQAAKVKGKATNNKRGRNKGMAPVVSGLRNVTTRHRRVKASAQEGSEAEYESGDSDDLEELADKDERYVEESEEE